ncbi:MAG: DMT family transporter [Actinomycetota bacterium]|nr:DMT family transporter [Actinomycetota bacterium]
MNRSQAGAVALSLSSALLYAITSVLQQSAACRVPAERSLRPGLLVDLVRHPRWLLGGVAEVGAVVLQFLALRTGSLLVVQTLLVTGLLFAIPMAATLRHERLSARDWSGTLLAVLGLAVFLAVARPTRGRGNASPLAWAVMLGLGGGIVALLVVRAPAHPGARRAAVLGTACGILFGLNAALTKASGHLLDRGIGHALTSWEPYALAALGAYGFLLAQSAFHAGPLPASLPVLTVTDPLVAAVIGVFAFHEHVASSPAALAAELTAVVAMVAGVFTLARSPLATTETAPGPAFHTD